MSVTSLINPHLRAVARWRVNSDVLDGSEFEKTAQPPGMDPAAGGGPPGGAPPMPDPMAMAAGGGGGAPPMGGAPPPPPGPLDPATLAQITQAISGAGGGMGAGAGPGGKMGGGKKAEQQLLDTKLWTIQFLLVKVCEALNVQVPPSIVVGPPPDPMMMQQAQTEQAAPGGGGATMQGPGGGAGGAPGGGAPPAGPGPIPPMDASQGPIGGAPGGAGGEKMGSAIRSLSSLMDEDGRRPFDVGSEYSLESLREVRSKAAAMAALSRSLKNGAA